jgi:hypothetical protein
MIVSWRHRGMITTRLIGDVDVIRFDYELPLEELIPSSPHSMVRVKSNAIVNWLSGERRVVKNSGLLKIGEVKKARIADCEYAVIPVVHFTDEENKATALSYDYAPEIMAWLRITLPESGREKSPRTSLATKLQILD